MSLAASQPALGLSRRLAQIIEGLCGALAARMAKDRNAAPVLFVVWTRLRRLARFEKLVADIRAGRGPAVRDRLESLPQLPGLLGSPPPPLPREFGWLLRVAPESVAYAGQVEYLLADPEMKALLAGSPQARRLLRPLCRMLGIRPGPELVAARPGPPDATQSGAATSGSPPGSDQIADAEARPAPSRRLGLPLPAPNDAGADPPGAVPWLRFAAN